MYNFNKSLWLSEDVKPISYLIEQSNLNYDDILDILGNTRIHFIDNDNCISSDYFLNNDYDKYITEDSKIRLLVNNRGIMQGAFLDSDRYMFERTQWLAKYKNNIGNVWEYDIYE